ncbi:hypothetical protein T09_9769 [Trichinella sp. T9]|nr:hypothetical protein T09_9769 [Trichinella sp. T9]
MNMETKIPPNSSIVISFSYFPEFENNRIVIKQSKGVTTNEIYRHASEQQPMEFYCEKIGGVQIDQTFVRPAKRCIFHGVGCDWGLRNSCRCRSPSRTSSGSLTSLTRCNEPLSRAGSFLASTGFLPRSLLNDDTPVSNCRFISASVSSVRLLPALPSRFPNSHFVGNILALKVTEQEYNIYSQSQQRPPPYITQQPIIASRC